MIGFCWKFCRNVEVKVLFGFLLSLSILNGITSDNEQCNYYQNLEIGKTYYAYNLNYSNKDKGEEHCIWRMENPYVTKINCSIDIPTLTNDCTQSSISVKFVGKNITYYCGKGTFELEGKNPTITFDLSVSQEGNFLCEIRAEKSFDNNCKCGWKKVTRIVGGNETGVNEYSMMGGLVDMIEKQIYCGCTIISEQYVITAAHCLDKKNLKEVGVLVGEHDVTTGKETNATKLFRINNCDLHPKYKDTYNDIAVCKIIGEIKYSPEVGPVCLPFQHYSNSFNGYNVTALGWGLLGFGGSKPNTPQKVELNVINLDKCKNYYLDVTDKNICTYTPGKDTCQMDSGGPLLWQDPETHNLVLVGITSSGIGCASDDPSVNTRVGVYIDWIKSVTPGVQYCEIE
ncbi:venom serine protease-like [Anoplolepis gracilipes]|uniref:venom serine protease-like n=1 Tax=Anoplolepis gracilipes TaxID=354296 RepID=UPI003BA3C295